MTWNVSPGAVRDAVAARRVTRLSLTPTMLARLQAGGWRPPAFLQTILLGGEPIPADLLARCPRAVASYVMFTLLTQGIGISGR